MSVRALKTQIYPTTEQTGLIEKTFGCCRFVYNNGLAFKKSAYEKDGTSVSSYDLIKRIPEQKREFEWLKEVDSQALQQSLLDLESAYKKFFREKKGFPNFHKKGDKESFRTLNARIETRRGVRIPKIGIVRTAERLNKRIVVKQTTISKRAGKYFASMLYEFVPSGKQKTDEKVGLDFGIKNLATLSNGEVIPNIHTTKDYERRLAVLQRRLSRKQKGSNNRKKAKLAVGKLHLKIANIRKDHLNKATTAITKRYTFVAIEDLNIKGMLKNHTLAKSIVDCSWRDFVRQLEYKGVWYGCAVRKIGRFEPSSKTCNVCGFVLGELKLSTREWTCPNCKTEHDRDLNAAQNVLKIALSDRQGEPVEMCGCAIDEAGKSLKATSE